VTKANEGSRAKKSGDERRAASEKHDEQFFKDRKVTEARNLDLTLKLKAQRLAHEAAQPKVEKTAAPRKRVKAAKNASRNELTQED
jgi:hypothetical protein